MTPDQLPIVALVALGVGVVVGLTGMGGGALLTPALILFGVPPVAAVSNDLVAAAFTKSVGAVTHWRQGRPELAIAGWLILGSVPSAFLGGWIVRGLDAGSGRQLVPLIGCALLLAAVTNVAQRALAGRRRPNSAPRRVHPPATVLIGAVVGLLVGVTSVGSGSLIMASLLLLYPWLSSRQLVGTDLVQAVPLVLSAAVGHVLASGFDLLLVVALVLGGAPGTYLGARLGVRVNQGIVRVFVVAVLVATGLTMLGVPPLFSSGTALLVLFGLLGARRVVRQRATRTLTRTVV